MGSMRFRTGAGATIRRRVGALAGLTVLLAGLGLAEARPAHAACISAEAWVQVLGGSKQGLTSKTCLVPTSCKEGANVGPLQAGPTELLRVGVGVWTVDPADPSFTCLVS